MLNNFFGGCEASNSKTKYINRPSVTKSCKPSRLAFRFQVQAPTTVCEHTLSTYNSFFCYKLSDVAYISFILSCMGVKSVIKKRRTLLRSGETLHDEHKTKSLLELLHNMRFVSKLLYHYSWY